MRLVHKDMPAGTMGGCEISIRNDGDFTIATVKMFPNVMEVKVARKKDTYSDLLRKIETAFLQCYAYSDVQF